MTEYCVLYGRIVVGFTVFYMLQNIFQSFLAAAEKPGLGLIVTLIAGCANAALDALFIVVFKRGIAGAAIYSSGFFTALNNGLVSAILSLMRSLVFQVTFVFVLPLLFGVDGIWWAMFATEVGATVVAVVFFFAYRKKYRYF